jgi:uncharacterized membrane protein
MSHALNGTGKERRMRTGESMADLIAIGYPDETTAEAAADEARRRAHDLIIQPDAIAVIVRGKEGSCHVRISHHPVGMGAT